MLRVRGAAATQTPGARDPSHRSVPPGQLALALPSLSPFFFPLVWVTQCCWYG